MIALSTGSLYSYGLARVFELAARAGFDGIEVLVDHRWDTRQPAYLQQLADDFELPIVALHNPFASQVEGWPDDELGRLRHTVSLAQEVGAPVVVAHLPHRFHAVTWHLHAPRPRRFWLPLPIPRRGPFYRFIKDEVAAMERETGVVLGVENMPAKRFLGVTINPCWFNSPAKMARFPHLTLDTTHLGTWGLDPLAVYERLRERVFHVHLSNYDGREHRSPPDGRLRLADLLQALARDEYRGAVTVECDPGALDAEDEATCLAALRRAQSFCRTHYNGR
jgi:sugar phosphate isomerase/epimerase